jgi:hypothetical protein
MQQQHTTNPLPTPANKAPMMLGGSVGMGSVVVVTVEVVVGTFTSS